MIAMLFTSNSGGYSSGRSGSPGDGNTCAECHSGGSFGASVAITSNIPVGGYALNTSYNITVTLTSSPNSTKSGFQITSEKSGGTKVGTFAGNTSTGTQGINSSKGVTHTSTGNSQKTWTFSWISPSNNEGTVTFYAASVASNNSGNFNGDQVVTTSTAANVLSNDSFGLTTFKLFPNPTTDLINIELPQGYSQATVQVVDVMGRTVLNTKITETTTSINVESLPAGTYILNLISDDASTTRTFVKN